jgi:F-type H+-transporting ATPase subunit a
VAEEAQGGGLAFHPMDQFLVKPLFGGDEVTGTPHQLHALDGARRAAVAALFVLGTRGRGVVPTRVQSVAELIYGFIHKMVEDVAGKDALKFFPYIFTLFLFILFANFLALIPTSFSPTSHIAVTAVMALGVFLTVVVVGFVKNGAGLPQPVLGLLRAAGLRPILAVIEVISFFVRPVSHSVRLAGAIMAGHAVMKVFAAFAGAALIAPIAIGGMVAIYALEFLVAAIQAYVFTILTCVYLKDALHPHH